MRKAMSKRLRFAVFSRDNFQCRYCGRQPDTVTLHVDHIVPVSQGGTNDEANLVTACVECNLGKGANSPTTAAPSESDRLRLAQEMREQRASLALAQEMVKHREELREYATNLWCDLRGLQEEPNPSLVSALVNIALEYGVPQMTEWVRLACRNLAKHYGQRSRDVQVISYVHGIKRNQVAEGIVQPVQAPFEIQRAEWRARFSQPDLYHLTLEDVLAEYEANDTQFTDLTGGHDGA